MTTTTNPEASAKQNFEKGAEDRPNIDFQRRLSNEAGDALKQYPPAQTRDETLRVNANGDLYFGSPFGDHAKTSGGKEAAVGNEGGISFSRNSDQDNSGQSIKRCEPVSNQPDGTTSGDGVGPAQSGSNNPFSNLQPLLDRMQQDIQSGASEQQLVSDFMNMLQTALNDTFGNTGMVPGDGGGGGNPGSSTGSTGGETGAPGDAGGNSNGGSDGGVNGGANGGGNGGANGGAGGGRGGDGTAPATNPEGTPPVTKPSNTPPGATPPDANPGSGFAIQSGQLLFNGALVNGVAVTGEYAQQVGPQVLADQIASQFPGVNVVRLATSPDGGAFTNGSQLSGGESVQDIDNVIQALNAKGIGVIVDNHGSDANTPDNVAQDGNEAAWFGQLAKDNLGNNMVMFQTQNEPMGSNQDIVNEQLSAYNAIRATGSNAIVAFDLAGGGDASPMLSNPSAYSSLSNYVIDAHSYAANNSDPASALAQEVSQTAALTEANGAKVPVYIGETGNSIDGSNLDPAAAQELNAVWSGGTGGIAWLYDGAATGFGNGNGADHLTYSDGSLSSYGQEIASLIQRGAS